MLGKWLELFLFSQGDLTFPCSSFCCWLTQRSYLLSKAYFFPFFFFLIYSLYTFSANSSAQEGS